MSEQVEDTEPMAAEAEGVWRMEMLSRDGWEAVGTAFIEGGRYLRGSSNACTMGAHRLDGNTITIEATTMLFEGAQTVYGRKSGEIHITYTAQIDDDRLDGVATNGEYPTQCGGTRIGEFP